MKRSLTLLAVAAVGLAIGYLAVQGGGSGASQPAPPPAGDGTPAAAASPAPAAGPAARDAPPGAPAGGPSDSVRPPPTRGSSFTVVGGMSREEMIKHGILPPPPDRQAAVAGPGQRVEGPPAALAFPPAVREAAHRYWCLCGRGLPLDKCPCNRQPIGARTMLTHLQHLVEQGLTGDELDAGMVDRYGPRVLVESPDS